MAIPDSLWTASHKLEGINAVKAILKVHAAQSRYYQSSWHFAASLRELNLPDAVVGYRFNLKATPPGYTIRATSQHRTYLSGQSEEIHVHTGPEPATAGDPRLSEPTDR